MPPPPPPPLLLLLLLLPPPLPPPLPMPPPPRPSQSQVRTFRVVREIALEFQPQAQKGGGIFDADGDHWKLQRKLAAHEFSVRSLRDFMTTTFRAHVGKLCEIVDAHAGAPAPERLPPALVPSAWAPLAS